LGSLGLACTTASAVLFSGLLHILLALFLDRIAGSHNGAWRQHSVGFSGVLFHYLTLECHLDKDEDDDNNDNNNHSSSASSTGPRRRRRSLFGLVDIPTRLYPWALYVIASCGCGSFCCCSTGRRADTLLLFSPLFSLVALQVTMPNLSLLGHLSGILTGTLQASSGGQSVFAPTFEALARIERSAWCRRILPLLARVGYVAVPTSAPALFAAAARRSGSGGAGVGGVSCCGTDAIAATARGVGAGGRMGTCCDAASRAAARAMFGRDGAGGGGGGVPLDDDEEDDNNHGGPTAAGAAEQVRRLGAEWRRVLANLARALLLQRRARSGRRRTRPSPPDDDDEERQQLLLVETTTAVTTRTTGAAHRRSDHQDGSDAGGNRGEDDDDDDAAEEGDVAFV
jgi:hypothetical protein